MCDCLQILAEQHSEAYTQNGKPACVYAKVMGEIQILPWVKDKRPYQDTRLHEKDEIKRSSKAKYASVPLNFCAVCGERTNGASQGARVWND